MDGDIYELRIKKRAPSIIIVNASRFFKLSEIIGMCKLNFNAGKILILKVVFFLFDA